MTPELEEAFSELEDGLLASYRSMMFNLTDEGWKEIDEHTDKYRTALSTIRKALEAFTEPYSDGNKYISDDLIQRLKDAGYGSHVARHCCNSLVWLCGKGKVGYFTADEAETVLKEV
jgi:hypothetical protein